MEGSVIKAAGGSLALAIEAIHAYFRLLIERWAEAEPLVVTSQELLRELHDSGWPGIDDQVCYAVASRGRDETEKLGQSPDRVLVFSRIWKRLLPATIHDQDVKYYLMRAIRRRCELRQPSAGTARALHFITSSVAPLVERSSRAPVPYEDFLATINSTIESRVWADDAMRADYAR